MQIQADLELLLVDPDVNIGDIVNYFKTLGYNVYMSDTPDVFHVESCVLDDVPDCVKILKQVVVNSV